MESPPPPTSINDITFGRLVWDQVKSFEWYAIGHILGCDSEATCHYHPPIFPYWLRGQQGQFIQPIVHSWIVENEMPSCRLEYRERYCSLPLRPLFSLLRDSQGFTWCSEYSITRHKERTFPASATWSVFMGRTLSFPSPLLHITVSSWCLFTTEAQIAAEWLI